MVPVPKVWFGWVPWFSLLASPCSLSANDWPHWRGPSATGVAAPSPLPAAWSATRERRVAGAAAGRRRVVADRVGQARLRDARRPATAGAATAGIRRSTQGGDPATAGESHAVAPRRAPTSRSSSKPSIERRASGCGFTRWRPQGELPPVHDKHNLVERQPGHRRRARLRVVRHRADSSRST